MIWKAAANRVSDGHRPYLYAVEAAFADQVVYAYW